MFYCRSDQNNHLWKLIVTFLSNGKEVNELDTIDYVHTVQNSTIKLIKQLQKYYRNKWFENILEIKNPVEMTINN